MHTRLLLTWVLFSVAGAGALGGVHVPSTTWVVAACALWGALSASGARSTLLLGGARRGVVVIDEAAPPHRLWRGGLLSLVAGALLGGVIGVVAQTLRPPSSWATWAIVLAGVCVLSFAAGARLAATALRRPRARRTTTLFAWVLLDTALPAGALAALLGVVVVRVRFAGLESVSALEAARHVAVSLLLYGALLGVGGALKTARERLGGLIDAPSPEFEAPGALATGGVLGLVVLVVGPRVLGPVDVEVLVVTKALIGVVLGTALCALGALRGARR